MRNIAVVLLQWVVVACFCSGCIALPIPHTYVKVPETSGTVGIDCVPVETAELDLKYEHNGEVSTIPLILDQDRRFHVPEERARAWWFLIPLVPVDYLWQGTFTLIYRKQAIWEQTVGGIGDLNETCVEKIDLGRILARPGADCFLQPGPKAAGTKD